MRYWMIADAFARAGWRPLWITADFDHLSRAARAPREWSNDRRIAIDLVPVRPYSSTLGLQRYLSHVDYCRGLSRRMRSLAHHQIPRAILVSLPLAGAVRAALRMRKASGCAVVCDVQDLWPEGLLAALPPSLRGTYRLLGLALAAYERRLVRRCDGVVAVSLTYLHSRSDERQAQQCSYLGADLGDFRLHRRPPEARTGDPLRLLWEGSLRPHADLPTVLAGLRILLDRDRNVVLTVMGDGPEAPRVARIARDLGLTPPAFSFVRRFAPQGLAEVAGQCDAGLNSYVEGSVLSLGNKLFVYSAAGLAIVNSVRGEASALVAQAGMGVDYAAGDSDSFARAVERLIDGPFALRRMQARAAEWADAEGDRRQIAARIVGFVRGIAEGRVSVD